MAETTQTQTQLEGTGTGINDNNKCFICSATDFGPLSYIYSHKSENEELHMLCVDCVKLNAKVCTCEKTFMDEEPSKISIVCGTCDPPRVLYFDIKHGETFRELIRQWSREYYIIDGCRGCKFTKNQIETNFNYAKQAAIVACVYKLMPMEGDEEDMDHMTQYLYVSDALDDDFIERAEALGVKIGEKTDLIAT